MNIVKVVFPVGAFGASDNDDDLDRAMRIIAISNSQDADAEWAEKYGTDVDNEVFMMHRFCWCEQEDCPWCGGCDEEEHFSVDGSEVTYQEWCAFFNRETYQKLGLWKDIPSDKHDEWMALADLANKRRDVWVDEKCDYCTATGVFSGHGEEPRRGAPNFWHKPSGLKVWWYKYIGRDMEVVGSADLAQVVSDCTLK